MSIMKQEVPEFIFGLCGMLIVADEFMIDESDDDFYADDDFDDDDVDVNYDPYRENWIAANAMRAQQARGYDKITAVINYMEALGPTERVKKLVPLIEHEPAEIFWPIFHKIWPYCFHTHRWHKRLLKALQRVEAHHSVRHLPEVLTVYRGSRRSRITGLAWTRNLKLARWFARDHHFQGVRIAVPDGVVAMARIKRSDAFWYSNGRGEHEVICWPTEWSIMNFGQKTDHKITK